MSGSRLGRGRVGRLALLVCGALGVVFLVFLYRSTSAEMAKLRDLHVKCAQQQEALAAQLQVLYEYKVQLEKTLSNEKSANAAAKEELQQKATRERSLRDKDSLEAMQRFNSLQQNYKLLVTEHQDLKDDCKKKEDVALENAKVLESRLQEVRVQMQEVKAQLQVAKGQVQEAKAQLKQAAEDKAKSMEHLKNKYTEIVQEKETLEEKYNNLRQATGDNNGDVERLQKQVMQLQRELEGTKKSPHFSVGGLKMENSQILPRHVNEADLNSNDNDNNDINNNNVNPDNEKPAGLENNQMQVIRPSSQQQAAVSASNAVAAKLVGAGPLALQSPSESSSKPSSSSAIINNNNNKPPTKVRLPVGVPPIPRLPIEAKQAEEQLEPEKKRSQQESAAQAPPAEGAAVGGNAGVDSELLLKLPADDQLGNEELEAAGVAPLQLNGQQNGQQQPRHLGEQILNRHEAADGWYKLKPGVQEVGDPHHIDKNGFENAGGNEDEQYDDYNYKEPQNKNGDLRLEEGEDEREDEDDYMHNNMNAVKHE